MSLKDLLAHPSIRGICLGCCVGGKRIAQGNAAHAHYPAGKYSGWICIDSYHYLTATTLRHEISHLIRSNDKHDEPWRREVRALGGRVERKYQ